MMIRCKVCGGDLVLSGDKTCGICDHCGSVMTLPRLDDEQRAAAFNRGNHFRRIGEFDKALAIYERIVQEDDSDAEAHWCCALCRFGVEYVEDPATYDYLPTCHRMSYDSFLGDVDYLAAVKYSQGITKREYQRQGVQIAEVQRSILAASQKEEPYDVFLCCKELDEQGERTVDSTLAQDIYYQLTGQGLRVFCARISLEEKSGAEYEPIIFGVLHSARVMVTVSTRPEHLTAVWVKNEWSRFLALMKKDRTRLMIPCWRDMDPYTLPEPLSVFQSCDMRKIGFIQELTRRIRSALHTEKEELPTSFQREIPGERSLLDRGWLFLESGDPDRAEDYFNRILDHEPRCAEAYLGLLCIEVGAKSLTDIPYDGSGDPMETLRGHPSYQRAVEFADGETRKKLTLMENALTEKTRERGYTLAEKLSGAAHTVEEHLAAAKSYQKLENFRDAAFKAEAHRNRAYHMGYESGKRTLECSADPEELLKAEKTLLLLEDYQDARQLAPKARRKAYDYAAAHYRQARTAQETEEAAGELHLLGNYMDSTALCALAKEKAADFLKDEHLETARRCRELDTPESLQRAVKVLATIPGWKDADKERAACRKRMEELAEKAGGRKRRTRKALLAACVLLVLGVLGAGLGWKIYRIAAPKSSYQRGVTLRAEGSNAEAAMAFGKAAMGYSQLEGEENRARAQDSWNQSLALWEPILDRHSIAAGNSCSGILYKTGRVELLGSGSYPAIASAENVVDLAVSRTGNHVLALRKDGTVLADGDNRRGQCQVEDWNHIVAVSAGEQHSLGLRADGTVVAAGYNQQGQCSTEAMEHIIAVDAESNVTICLRADGTLETRGFLSTAQEELSRWRDIDRVQGAIRFNNDCIGLRKDGSMEALWNCPGDEQEKWVNLAAIDYNSDYQVVGVKKDGSLLTGSWQTPPLLFPELSGWEDLVSVSISDRWLLGLSADGSAHIAELPVRDAKTAAALRENVLVPPDVLK